MSEYHNPVLLKESVDALVIDRDGVYADATFGGGGHSREILSRLSSNGRLVGFDRDADAIAAKTCPSTSRYRSPAPTTNPAIHAKALTTSVEPTNTTGSLTATYSAISTDRHHPSANP